MITSKRMRALEINSDSLGVSTLQLMENAGRAVVEEIEKEVSLDNVSATVFVGHGGKGGDGLVVARQLAGRGAKVRVILLGEIKHKDALVNLNAVMEMDYSVELKEVYDLSELTPTKSDVLIDAMLGTGVKGKIREPFVTAIEVFNKSQGFKVSIDVPSGLDPDTGESLGAHVTPDLVVTFHDMKVGLLKVGFRTVVKKIGIPPEAELYVGPGDLMVNLKPRDMKSRKGVGGRVLVVGGSKTFSGASALAGMAALRTGADLVYIASPEETAKTIASYSPDLIVVKLRGENFNQRNLEELKPWAEKANAVIFGPGLGLDPETIEAALPFLEMLMSLGKPVVLDADGLKAAKGHRLNKNVVITPHPGEFKIFFGEDQELNERKRIQQVMRKAEECNCVILLKGYLDIISDGREFRLNKTGNPGMTTGGTGDTLTGIIGTLLAQGLTTFDAASIGALINSLAGTVAFSNYGAHITATDVIANIPYVMNDPVGAFKKKVYKRVISW